MAEPFQERLLIAIQPINHGLGFSIELQATDNQAGEIFNLGQGAYRLARNSNGELELSLRTTVGTYTVTSAAITEGNWTRVAGRYLSDQLELSIDGTLYSTAATGGINYNWVPLDDPLLIEDPTAPHDLVIGYEYQGKLNSFKWYNHNDASLLTFAGGVTTQTFTIPDDANSLTVNLLSVLHPLR